VEISDGENTITDTATSELLVQGGSVHIYVYKSLKLA
jgi:hypothetical protein